MTCAQCEGRLPELLAATWCNHLFPGKAFCCKSCSANYEYSYRAKPRLAPPQPLPTVLKSPWRMWGGFDTLQVVDQQATWDDPWGVYRWTLNGDSQACGPEDVDWRSIKP
jgi:hypothetical protein